ncbi:hypothetical protein BS17DRAFT_776875 [Gyrodon lividus]|nr:hypothetical protein BS17DRAFT_776875 [Gyrodon lividus]
MLHLGEQSHRLFIALPIFAAFIWFASLLALLLTWLISGRPKYVSQEGSIAYISDVGASFLKPLFVIACCIAGVGLFLSLVLERLLRHRGRLPPDMRRRERVLGTLAIVGAFIAMWGLILLSGFDTGRYPTLHRIFLLVFMLGVALSALFTVLEFKWLTHDYADMQKLRRAYIAKAVIGGTLVLLAIVFGVALFYAPDAGGVIEWVIAFGFTFYLLTFCYDLRMAKETQVREGRESMAEIPGTQGTLGRAEEGGDYMDS